MATDLREGTLPVLQPDHLDKGLHRADHFLRWRSRVRNLLQKDLDLCIQKSQLLDSWQFFKDRCAAGALRSTSTRAVSPGSSFTAHTISTFICHLPYGECTTPTIKPTSTLSVRYGHHLFSLWLMVKPLSRILSLIRLWRCHKLHHNFGIYWLTMLVLVAPPPPYAMMMYQQQRQQQQVWPSNSCFSFMSIIYLFEHLPRPLQYIVFCNYV